MRVLVTGAAGFIGSHIVALLQQRDHAVVVFDNLSTGRRENLPANLPFFEVDLRDRATVARLFDEVRPEVVCHQAAHLISAREAAEVLGWQPQVRFEEGLPRTVEWFANQVR